MHVVTTIGSRKWTLAVPSMIITTSEIVARCTPPSIAAAPAREREREREKERSRERERERE